MKDMPTKDTTNKRSDLGVLLVVEILCTQFAKVKTYKLYREGAPWAQMCILSELQVSQQQLSLDNTVVTKQDEVHVCCPLGQTPFVTVFDVIEACITYLMVVPDGGTLPAFGLQVEHCNYNL